MILCSRFKPKVSPRILFNGFDLVKYEHSEGTVIKLEGRNTDIQARIITFSRHIYKN